MLILLIAWVIIGIAVAAVVAGGIRIADEKQRQAVDLESAFQEDELTLV